MNPFNMQLPAITFTPCEGFLPHDQELAPFLALMNKPARVHHTKGGVGEHEGIVSFIGSTGLAVKNDDGSEWFAGWDQITQVRVL